jgi:hypothetical protein
MLAGCGVWSVVWLLTGIDYDGKETQQGDEERIDIVYYWVYFFKKGCIAGVYVGGMEGHTHTRTKP